VAATNVCCAPHMPPRPTETARNSRSLKLPLLLNLGLLLFLALLAHGLASLNSPNHRDEGEAAFGLFWLLVGQLALNVLAVLLCLVLGKRTWIKGLLLSGLLVCLVGLGTCAYSLEHLHFSVR
jgi:hypothetical protein